AGIAAITHPDLRWARRDLKTTMLLPAVLAKRAAKDRGAAEALLVGEDGLVHEGASSNVMIVEGGAVITPAQDSTLLPGTMRLLLTEVAREASVPLRSEPLPLERLRAASEVFVTSSSQLAMPVVSLDGQPIGGGVGGPVARDLARRLRARLELDEAG
ncbi:MAG: aminotransferase class IV, partial [Deltaproteobacteria bacterium]|nr:aminotransferase class IV [Deltaproteobacteria bacterium]